MSNLQDVINRANTDQQFRSRLKANPAAACQEAGVEVPKQATFEVIERSRNDLHLLLGGRTNVPELDRIVERADKDAAFKEQLLRDPKSAVEAATGEKLPATCKVHVREADPNRIYIFLDEQGADGELSENELAGVAGGNPFLAGVLLGTIIGGGAAIATIVVTGGEKGTLKGLSKPKNPPPK